VVAFEKVMLYGIPIVASRKVDYGRIDPEVSRELFIRHALVEGDWRTHHKFFQANRDMLADVEELENRVRRRDIVVDDETMFAFYDARIPADVVSGRHFDAWWKQARRTQPDLLTFTESMLVSDEAGALAAAEYPDAWHQGDLALPLSYQFEPGTAADGVTVHIPLPVLNRVDPAGFDWQIPGLRLELVTALIKSLPKALRVNFVPAPDRARAALQAIGPDEGPLLTALADELYRMTRVSIPRDAWALDRVPDHLRVTFRVEDAGGRVRGEGKDLDALKRQLAPRVRVTMAEAAVSIERGGLTSWPGEALPRTFERSGAGGHAVKGYPALVDEGATVAVRVLGSVAEQEAAHWRGVRRLLLLTTANPLRAVLGGLSNRVKLALGRSPYGDVPALLDDAVTAAVDRLIEAAGGPPWDAAGFEALRETVRTDLPGAVVDTVGVVAEILTAAHAVESRISSVRQPALLGALTDIRTQLAGLVFEGFVSSTGCRRLPDVLRYLQGIERRLDKLAENPNRDREWTARVEAVREAYRDLVLSLPPARRQRADVRQIRWMIEELRVSLFAQSLKTAYPVSEQRIYKAMDQLPA
jgi:ATP-dependent helicase HrpA